MWGYGMAWHKLRTMNTITFYQWQFECMTRSWRPVLVPFTHHHHLMFQHDNARPHGARICTQFLEAENVLVLPWPAYSPDISPIEHVWDVLDRCVRQHVPVPANIQKLSLAIEWDHIPQATINNLINST
uniref:Tc1-like transposase DDE domain-containing protein n=1 Tax=Oncorhynchus tshawytscha TaxID=74940 RepID=A0AAZ3RHJ3_ONCTS